MKQLEHSAEPGADAALRPYNPDGISDRMVETEWMKVRLDSGAEVWVGKQHDHPHGGGISLKHEFRNTQPEGYRSQLTFSLSREAASALVALYAAHGIVLDKVVPT